MSRRALLKLALILFGAGISVEIVTSFAYRFATEGQAGRSVAAAAALLLALHLCTLALTIVAGWIRPAVIRWAVAIVIALSTGFVTGAVLSSGVAPTLDVVAMAIDSVGAVREFLEFNLISISVGCMAALLTLVGIGLRPPAVAFDRLSLPVVVAGLVGLALLAGFGRAWAVSGAAPGWSGTALALADRFGASRGTTDRAPPPALDPAVVPADGDVVLIVDESVGGHYLDLNRTGGVRSGLLPAPTGVSVANFGIAASATNFSVGTNYILRTGGTRRSFLKRSASIWAYAHRAGYRTVHLFAQTAPGLQNLMTPTERGEIDRYVRLDDVSPNMRDHAAAAIVRDLMHNGIREFIYVNKLGAHFPAWRFYPTDQTRYRPTLARRTHLNATFDTGSAAAWRLYRNDYRNVVRWSVGGFFDVLLARGVPDGATILYTSDHGEAMGERGAAVRLPHGNSEQPVPEEGAVPLVVLTPSGVAGDRWKRAVAATTGTSHYRLFPTLLALFGYDRVAVRPLFGPDLFAGGSDPMTFNSRFYSGGTEPAWHRVVPPELVDPTR